MSPRPEAKEQPAQARVEVVDAPSWADEAARFIADALCRAVEQRGAATLMLAGGSTPRAAYERLALLSRIPWERVAVFFGDERAVPADHRDSNYAMAQAALLDKLEPPPRVHRLAAESTHSDEVARAYAELLPPQVDVLILGIGEDGHTASLFPGSAALDATGRGVVSVIAPKPPPQRLSITPEVIRSARTCWMLATGPAKAEAVAAALLGPEDIMVCPAQLARGGVWVLDPAAAARLAV